MTRTLIFPNPDLSSAVGQAALAAHAASASENYGRCAHLQIPPPQIAESMVKSSWPATVAYHLSPGTQRC